MLLTAAFLAILPLSTVADDVLLSARLTSPDSLNKRSLSDPAETYDITFLHVNDVHAHLDQYRTSGTDCDPPSSDCVGGYSRIKTKVNEIRDAPGNALVLNMGDEFQGTLFYSYYKGEKIAETVNDLGFDAMTIGNHEFDGGDDALASYLGNVTIPVVSANIATNNTLLASRIKPYHIFPEHSLAVIGLTTIHTKTTSSPGSGTEFLDPVQILQQTVDVIEANENVTRIIAMTHIGYAEDIDLASRTRGIHLILGGHSHTLLGDFAQASGPYPTIQRNLDGEEVFIVTAWRWGQVLGYINVSFETTHNGRILAYKGGPIPMNSSTKQDKALQEKIDDWRVPFDAFSKEIVGVARDVLDGSSCQLGECTLGNAITDAILDYRLASGGKVDGAIMNAGGIRASIPAGNVTRGQIATSFPFSNAVIDLPFTGRELWNIFEGIVSWRNSAGKEVTSFVQISRGMTFKYAPNNPAGKRLVAFEIGGEPVDPRKTYIISTIDFIALGGDGFLYPSRKDYVPLNTLDVVLTEFIEQNSPYTPFIEGRISKIESAQSMAEHIFLMRGRGY